jgi:hypothetical protein
MGGKTDYVAKKHTSLKDRSVRAALTHRIGQEFPRMGGPRIRDLCAEMVLEVVDEHRRPRERVGHAQVLWVAYHVDDKRRRGKRALDSQMIPVVLDLVTDEDVDAIIARRSSSERLEAKVVRLSRQAHEQRGLLANTDLAVLTGHSESRVASVLAAYERRTGTLVPRRATLHDMGTGLTHKRVICLKRYRDGKPPDQIARETYHSLEAVDRYLGQFDRVRCCRKEGMDAERTAYILGCGPTLVREYLAIDSELRGDCD